LPAKEATALPVKLGRMVATTAMVILGGVRVELGAKEAPVEPGRVVLVASPWASRGKARALPRSIKARRSPWGVSESLGTAPVKTTTAFPVLHKRSFPWMASALAYSSTMKNGSRGTHFGLVLSMSKTKVKTISHRSNIQI
jgi:hypothetical protein